MSFRDFDDEDNRYRRQRRDGARHRADRGARRTHRASLRHQPASGRRRPRLSFDTLNKLAAKGKIKEADAHAALARVHAADRCERAVGLRPGDRGDRRETWMSSASSSANSKRWSAPIGIAGHQHLVAVRHRHRGRLQHPERFAGYHFFNPVPLMKVVEVIAGLRPTAASATRSGRLCRADGPHAGAGEGHARLHRQPRGPRLWHRSACASSAKAWRLRRPSTASCATRPGFRLGPFELLDLTALDVSHPVMESIYRQYYDEPRYRPSVDHGAAARGGLLWAARPAKASTATRTARSRSPAEAAGADGRRCRRRSGSAARRTRRAELLQADRKAWAPQHRNAAHALARLR